ncbi:MAG TPA: hypothetical protein PKV71_22045 [Calditrichia bacterium]|nr:hypothetical protein [Calditrichota bacterium]HQV34589.1 hypothetical protein [Calditrichia bacterium]
MAKKQSFESKTKKGSAVDYKVIKLVFPYKSPKTNSWKYAEKFVKVPLEGNEQQFIDDSVKSGLAYLENHS